MTRLLQDCDIRSSMTMRRFGHAKKLFYDIVCSLTD